MDHSQSPLYQSRNSFYLVCKYGCAVQSDIVALKHPLELFELQLGRYRQRIQL